MELKQLAGFLNTFKPMMKAFGVEKEPEHRQVERGDDMCAVLAHVQDIAFKATTEIHLATVTVAGRRVTILALQEPNA